MDRYDELFDDTRSPGTIFAEKSALDPLTPPDDVVARERQERRLATILNGVHEGYLPATVAIHGPPGTGKTLTTRRVCQAFADRHDEVAVEYVNLKECRSLFSAANEIHYELTGDRKGAYVGLDGVFDGIWTALEAYPEWTVLLLDEIDQIRHDTNYDPSEFFYRLLRGEGKLRRDIQLSAWLLSNELLEVDLRLDSRVESVMSDEQVFFPPYGRGDLALVLKRPLERAFQAGALPDAVRAYGIEEAARRWGDARKALRLFRRAGETASERELEAVTRDCIDANIDATEKATILEKLAALPGNHLYVLTLAVSYRDRHGEIKQPITTRELNQLATHPKLTEHASLSERAIRQVVRDLETMGLLDTWIENRGRDGRIKHLETTFNPEWVLEADATPETSPEQTRDKPGE